MTAQTLLNLHKQTISARRDPALYCSIEPDYGELR